MEDRASIALLGAAAGAMLVGRTEPALRASGWPVGGPVDVNAARLANKLIGNTADAPVLELPIIGGQWRISGPTRIALTGADMRWTIDGAPLPRHRVRPITTSAILTGKAPRSGVYGYLAVSGWPITTLEATRQNGSIAIARDWRNNLTGQVPPPVPPEQVASLPGRQLSTLTVPAYPGPELRGLSIRQQQRLLATVWRITGLRNRQGIRLKGSDSEHIEWPHPPMISSPVQPGTVQLTPAGPILLGPDAQTIGGYPRVLQLDEDAIAAVYQSSTNRRLRFRLP